MKKLYTILTLAIVFCANAQVIIGNSVGTASNKTSVLLEFALGNKGIIVPYVTTLPSGTTLEGGTILLDAVNSTKARMKFFAGADGWKDLSGQDADLSGPNGALQNQPAGITETNAKAIIGARTSTADGVLILESTTKAMVLPQVDNVQSIPSPSPGMIVYVKGVSPSFNKRLAIFNGSKWSFFKP